MSIKYDYYPRHIKRVNMNNSNNNIVNDDGDAVQNNYIIYVILV